MDDSLTTLGTVPAIIALVTLAKRFGITGRWATLCSFLLGVAIHLAIAAQAGTSLLEGAARGALIGLGASGIYDVAKTISPTTPSTDIEDDIDDSDDLVEIDDVEDDFSPESTEGVPEIVDMVEVAAS
jgi:hypothetical protein